MINIPNLPPFKRMCVTIGNLPSSFMESMSYYEALCWLVKYLQEEVIPTVNINSEAITELQTYVSTYFDNLDVQEEINNKLDEMAESGELTDIIAQYLGLAGVLVYSTVNDMKSATNLVDGSVCKTLGYRTKGDGGSSYYKIREIINTDVVNERELISLSNIHLVAELITPTLYMTPEIFGSYGDGIHDDTSYISNAITYAKDHNLTTKLTKTYLIKSQMEVSGVIDGDNKGKLITDPTTRFTGGMFHSVDDLTVKNLEFSCSSNVEFTLDDKFTRYNNAIIAEDGKLYVDNCIFHNLYNCFITCRTDVKKIDIVNSYFSSDNKTNVYYANMISVYSLNDDSTKINISNNKMYGYEFVSSDTYDNDRNINAGGIMFSNVIVPEININNNILDNLGRYGSIEGNLGLSRICVLDFYFNVHNAKITNNKLTNCHWTPFRIHGGNNNIFDSNLITLSRNCTEDIISLSDTYSSVGDSPVGASNIKITNNVIKTNAGVFEKGITINGYSSYPTDKGFYGSVDNLIIANNTMDIKCKKVIFFDPTLKTCIISNNTCKSIVDDATVNWFRSQNESIIDTATHGRDYTGTFIDIYGNKVETGGLNVSISGSTADRTTLNSEITLNVYKNIFKDVTVGYCIYGASSTDKMIAVDNILWGVGGINKIGKAYNNISFYKSSGSGFESVGTGTDNTSYLIS